MKAQAMTVAGVMSGTSADGNRCCVAVQTRPGRKNRDAARVGQAEADTHAARTRRVCVSSGASPGRFSLQ